MENKSLHITETNNKKKSQQIDHNILLKDTTEAHLISDFISMHYTIFMGTNIYL